MAYGPRLKPMPRIAIFLPLVGLPGFTAVDTPVSSVHDDGVTVDAAVVRNRRLKLT